jgi:hypothetical protein
MIGGDAPVGLLDNHELARSLAAAASAEGVIPRMPTTITGRAGQARRGGKASSRPRPRGQHMGRPSPGGLVQAA